jgi:hypothetical protein
MFIDVVFVHWPPSQLFILFSVGTCPSKYLLGFGSVEGVEDVLLLQAKFKLSGRKEEEGRRTTTMVNTVLVFLSKQRGRQVVLLRFPRFAASLVQQQQRTMTISSSPCPILNAAGAFHYQLHHQGGQSSPRLLQIQPSVVSKTSRSNWHNAPGDAGWLRGTPFQLFQP